jgi:hypothetical protein
MSGKARSTGALVPAAARADSHLTEAEHEGSSAAIETFTRALGGRSALVDALSVTESDATTDKLVGLLLDPTYDTWSLRRICQVAGITVAEVFALFKRAAIARAHIPAAPIIASKLVGVVDDILTRAQPYQHPCDACGGAGTVVAKPGAEPTPCPTCHGRGTETVYPDLDRQRLALELGQLTARGGGITLQQNLITTERAGSAAPGALEQLQQALGELLFRPAASPFSPAVPVTGTVIEADAVSGPDAAPQAESQAEEAAEGAAG